MWRPSSIRPSARLSHDRRPARHIGANERCEVGGTHSSGRGALALELRVQLGIIKRPADRGVEPIGKLGRELRRREDTKPCRRFEALHYLADCWQIGK